MPLIILSGAWIAGIFIGSKFNLPYFFILAALIPIPLLFLFRRSKKAIILTGLCLLAIFFGALRFESSLPEVNEISLQFYNGRTVEIRGMVSADPDISNKSAHLRLSASDIKLAGGWQTISGTALVFAPTYADYRYGDILRVQGRLETPPQLDGFDYKDYLAHEGVYSTISFPGIEVLQRGKGNPAMDWIYSLRSRLSDVLTRVWPEPQASLAQGIVLGIRGNIPESLNADMSRTGTTHVLAISGLNISIVAGILLSLGLWLFGRRHYIYIWLALLAIWLYALLTGLNPPVVRGTIMASLFFAAELLGRQKGAMTSLAFAGAVMIGVSPQILWNASFQMSFMAMFGLIMITPAFQNKGREAVGAILGEDRPLVPVANFVIDSFSVSLGAVIAVSPVIAYYFGIFAFISPLATFFVLPVLPAIMVTGALAGIVGLVVLPAAQVIAWVGWLFTSYMLIAVQGFAMMPSYTPLSPGNAAPVCAYYLALGLVWLVSNRRKLTNPAPGVAAWLKSGADKASGFILRVPGKWVILPLFVLAIMTSVSIASMPDDNLHVSFLDVGEGDAIFIQTAAHQNVLIDGGPDSQKLSLALGEKMPFWDRKIDLVILTHPHQDHFYGLLEVLQRFEVGEVLFSALDNSSPAYEEWLKFIDEKGIKYATARGGELVKLNGGNLSVLSKRSFNTGAESDIDNNSLVLRLDAGKISFLFTADIMREAEWELISRRAELASTVLKVAHHGSDTSTTPEFLAAARPRLAVISVGAGNRFGHPGSSTLKLLDDRLGPANIYRTDQNGTVEFITNGERLWVKLSSQK